MGITYTNGPSSWSARERTVWSHWCCWCLCECCVCLSIGEASCVYKCCIRVCLLGIPAWSCWTWGHGVAAALPLLGYRIQPPPNNYIFLTVLVLDGLKLIFFIVACTVLCFGFVTKTVLITHQCLSYCWALLAQHQGLFCSSPHPTSKQAGGAQEVGRRHSRDSWPQLTQGISHPVWCHAEQ